ncbi:LOW QUALITY PROTEIN: hypothetical protein OSB04_016883 [Centaurea solstitialis]|uniref:Polyprotein n=1 Tax=Centaurea solstitialis TaxID=347529 RepID=A0AA38T1V1_9ASTR|nr:LOW QUALITY PROTEIN: hypothetical protein OSB04_016883 [Centaurea solstitialis]
MASTVTSTNNLSLRSILEKDKLTGSNFLDWERNLMIVLRHERKWYVLEEPLGEAPPANAPAAARNAHKKHSDDLLDVACLMLATMSPDLQAGLINTNAYDMIRQLRDMFQTQARTERYDATRAFNECKMVKGTSVSDHVMKMKRHLDHLERLGHPVPLQLATDTILNSLSEDYRPFVVNYNMNNMEKTIAELHSMLKTAELNMGNKNKTKDVLMVKDGGVKKKNGHASTSKGKGPVQAIQSAPKKGKGKGKGKKFKPNKARTENRCFICNEIGHWRQNCPKRHEAACNMDYTKLISLAHLGSAFNEPTLESIPIIHLTTLAIEAKEEVQMNEKVYNWSLDIWNYLKHDQLPDDKMEARKTRFKASRYTIFEDQLYRRSASGLILRCIKNKEQMNQILQEMNDGECGNHSGGRSLANRISRQGYYWSTLREDAIRYVQRCDACQRHSGMSHLPSEPLHSVLISWPFMRWGMDIVGKLPHAPGQKVFLVVLTDYFSKWIEAAAFLKVRDKEVISFIQTNIIYRFGVPSEIMCDNGSQFISEKTRKFCDERGIQQITSTPRYPYNKVIINSIRKRLKDAKGKWVEELPSAYRTTPRTSTRQNPFSLVYGCEAVLPIESRLPIARHRTIEQNAIDLYYDLDALEELKDKAFQKMAMQKAIIERYFNKKVKAKETTSYDMYSRIPNKNAGKLSIKWEGPYRISKIAGNGAYKLTTMEGKEIPRSWNATHLKRYYF